MSRGIERRFFHLLISKPWLLSPSTHVDHHRLALSRPVWAEIWASGTGGHMARVTDRLTAIKVGSLKAKGLHADGGGLYLRITASGSKNWIFRYTLDGKLRDMGLGPLTSVSLAQARKA